MSDPTFETSESEPWTIQRVLSELDYIDALDGSEICCALKSEADEFAASLRDAIPLQRGRARVYAAALLLMLNDRAGRDPFLEALAGPDGEERSLAMKFVEYRLLPCDLECRDDSLGKPWPLTSDEVFDAVKRDMHEPWTGLSERLLSTLSYQRYPQIRPLLRSLFAHPDLKVRLHAAGSFLSEGCDDGAFDVIAAAMRSERPFVYCNDLHWRDFYGVKKYWFSLKEAADRGDFELKNKVASLAMELITQAFDAPDCKQRFDFNEGLLGDAGVAEIVASVMPVRAKSLLQGFIAADEIDAFYRGSALRAYSQAVGDAARPMVRAGLRCPAIRKYAAEAMQVLCKKTSDPDDILALSEALIDEKRPDVVAPIMKALLAGGRDNMAAIEAALDRADPWTRFEISWRNNGGTDRELADLLTEAGVMDPVSDDQLAEALREKFDLLAFIWAGGKRLVSFCVKSTSGLKHFEFFQDLLKAARPTVAIDNLKETCNAELLREPVAEDPRINKVTDLGTVCTVSFQYRGERFSFDTHPQGRWHDVAGAMAGFDGFMQAIGRDDRCYELHGGGEWAIFVVAPASKFEPLVKRLGIPLERDPDGARDAARAFQCKVIQEM